MGKKSGPEKPLDHADQRLSLPSLCEAKLAALPPEYLANLLVGSLPHLPPALAQKITEHANVTATITMLDQYLTAADSRREARLLKSKKAFDSMVPKAEPPAFMFLPKKGG